MVAKNIKVLKEVGLLKNFRNSFLSLFFHFLYHFFSMHFINFMSLPVSWDGGGGGRKGGEGKKGWEKYKNEVSRRSLFCSY